MTARHPRRLSFDRFSLALFGGSTLGPALILAAAALAAPPDFSGVVAGSSAGAVTQTPSSAPSAPSFDRATVPSQGRQVAEMTVEEFGRYSVRVASPAGMSLQLIDRMSGPSPLDGVAGERNGRIDAFLDRGATRVVVTGAALGRGEARLSAAPFRELEATPVRLVEGRALATELGDLEQRSWWIEVRQRREVAIEAAGRYLADLRLWQNGSWLVDATPISSTVEPAKGRPLALRQIVATLEPGLYRVTAYGGVETAWAVAGTAAAEKPLYLRFGLDTRSGAGREAHTISNFGFDRYVLPGSSTLVRLELPTPPTDGALTLSMADWEDQQPLPTGESATQWVELDKATSPPIAEMHRGSTTRPFVTEVRGLAGQPYTLQHFATSRRTVLGSKPSRRWVGTVHAGTAADSLDATGVVFAVADRAEKTKVLAAQTIELSPTRGYRRRFNLFETAELFLHVAERTAFELTAEGLAAQYRLEPLLYSKPANYRAPAARAAPTSWTLEPGYYVLTLEPSEGGVLDLALTPKGAAVGAADGGMATGGSVYGAVNLGELNLQGATSYVLWTSNQGGVASGLISRTVPLDLTEPLPLSLRGGEERTLTFRAGEAGTLRATDDTGGALEVATAASSAGFGSEAAFEAGEHRVRIRNAAPETRFATVAFEPISHAPHGPLPAVSAETLAALPSFDRLREGSPLSFELARGASRTFLVEATEPGLYNLETQGLLAMGGALRTRVVPSLLAAEQNGVGRNVALRTYLREGEYQLTVQAQGLSAGEASVVLSRARLRDGGELAPTVAERVTLAAGDAIAHRFRMSQPARIHLEALRLGGRFDIRLEDLQGWPVGAPWTPGDIELDLAAGEYRSILAPRALEARALVRFAPVVEVRPRVGHGPHRLTLDQNVEAEWNEPRLQPSLRQPDHYTFDLPAAASTDIVLTDEMQGHLWKTGGQPIELPPGRTSRLALAAGSYEMAVVCSRRDSKHRYQVRVSPVEWVDGIDRAITAPVEIALSVGTPGTIELSSYGDADVRARLFDESGRALGSADDRTDDWNFLLSRQLEAGRYRLRVDPVGSPSAATRLALRIPAERSEAPLAAGSKRGIDLGAEIVLVPLTLPANAELFAAALVVDGAAGAGGSRLDLSLERRVGATWTTLASSSGERPWVALPLDAASRQGNLRLRLGSLDHRPVQANLLSFAGLPTRTREADLARGAKLAALGELPVAATAVTLDRPGCFTRGEGNVWQSRRGGEAGKARGANLAAAEGTLWLFQEGRSGSVTARRATLGSEAFRLPLSPGESIVCDLAAPDSKHGPDALRVVSAASLAGQPLVVVASAQRRDRATAVGPRRALAIAAPGANRVEISNPSQVPIEAQVSVSTLKSSQVTRSALASGNKRLRLGLMAGGWAVVGPLGSPQATLASFGEASETTLDSDTTEVTLYAPEPNGSRLESFVTAAAQIGRSTFSDGRLEVRTDRSGRLRREVPPGSGERQLQIRGGRATFVSADGQVARSNSAGSLTIGAAQGTLEIEHRPGFALAWFDDAAAGEFGPAATIALPAALPLAAPRQAFAFDVETPSLLVVRVGAPSSVSVVTSQGRAFAAFEDNTSFAAPVGSGRVTLGLAGLAGEPLVGTAEVTLEPITELRDGMTSPFLLSSGGTRAFSFSLTARRDVGFGVASDAGGTGEIDTVLYDADGREQSRGAVQRHVLDAGRYVLAVRAAVATPTAPVRLGIVGLAPPSEAPPAEEVRRFLELAAGPLPGATGDGRGVVGSADGNDPFLEPGSEDGDEYECSDCDEGWHETEGGGEGR